MKTTVLPPTDAGIAQAAAALRAGDPVVIPTETVYGLAADATSPDAVAAVFSAKGRPADDPLIVHVTPDLLGPDALGGLVDQGIVSAHLPEAQRAATAALMQAFWPGPLTFVLPRGEAIPEAVSSRLPTIAVRMPAHVVARAVIDAAGRPLVAPSANRFGRISPTTAAAAASELDGRVGLVVDGGACMVGVESTVVRVDADGRVGILRPGVISATDLGDVVPEPPYAVAASEGIAGAPGRLLRHYAPATPLVLVEGPIEHWSSARRADVRERITKGPGRLGYITWTGDPSAVGDALAQALDVTPIVRRLTPDGTVEEAAHNLYGMMRDIDAQGPSLLIVECVPLESGLGEAIADRLTRASHGTPPLAP